MRTRDLAAEMRAASAAMTVADLGRLADAEISPHLVGIYEMIGAARVRVEPGGDGLRWHPDDAGARAYIIPVRAHDAMRLETPEPWVAVRFGELIDLVAWDPAHAELWALRAGLADWLGAIEPQYLDPEPVRVWRAPRDWLAADCTGLVILTRDPIAARRLLAQCVGGIIADDQAHARMLRRLLEHPYPAPPVRVAGGRS